MPQVRKTIQIVDKGKVRFIQINHGVTLGLAANVGTLVGMNGFSRAGLRKNFGKLKQAYFMLDIYRLVALIP
jgi:hypothetical protein